MDFVSLSSSPHDDICVGWTREKTMTKSAKLLAYRTGVRPSPFFSSFTVECVSWYCRKANTFGKTKAILFLLWSIWFCREIFGFAVRFLVFPWCFCFCREVFGFAVTVVGHHSFVPRGVLGVSSDGDDRRIFLGLKFGKYFLGSLIWVGIFWGY